MKITLILIIALYFIGLCLFVAGVYCLLGEGFTYLAGAISAFVSVYLLKQGLKYG